MTSEEAEQRIAEDSAADNLAGGPCPFCKGQIAFPRRIEGREGYVMHTDPACSEYERAPTPGAFMTVAAMAKLGGL